MEKHLFCMIVRDRAEYLPIFYQCIKPALRKLDCQIDFCFYENDSKDNTQELLEDLLPENLGQNVEDVFVLSEKKETRLFSSVICEERVKNLSEARNQCLSIPKDLSVYSFVWFLDSDISFPESTLKNLLDNSIALDADILSGITYSSVDGHFYDSWATRWNDNDNFSEDFSKEILKMPSMLSVDSTFNGICLYKASIFQAGIRFGYFSETFNHFDCDTAVICENARRAGFNKIYIIPSIQICHFE